MEIGTIDVDTAAQPVEAERSTASRETAPARSERREPNHDQGTMHIERRRAAREEALKGLTSAAVAFLIAAVTLAGAVKLYRDMSEVA